MCPRDSPKRSLNTVQATLPDLKVGKGDLPPLPHPRDPSIVCKHPPRSQGWEGWLAPAALPKRALNTLQAPPRSQGQEGGPAPPFLSINTTKYSAISSPISKLGRPACPRFLTQ